MLLVQVRAKLFLLTVVTRSFALVLGRSDTPSDATLFKRALGDEICSNLIYRPVGRGPIVNVAYVQNPDGSYDSRTFAINVMGPLLPERHRSELPFVMRIEQIATGFLLPKTSQSTFDWTTSPPQFLSGTSSNKIVDTDHEVYWATYLTKLHGPVVRGPPPSFPPGTKFGVRFDIWVDGCKAHRQPIYLILNDLATPNDTEIVSESDISNESLSDDACIWQSSGSTDLDDSGD